MMNEISTLDMLFGFPGLQIKVHSDRGNVIYIYAGRLMSIDYTSIGERIKYYRTQRGLSQEELAELADISKVYICNVERGDKSVSLKVLVAVANALKVTADDILADSLPSLNSPDKREEFSILSDCSKEEHDIIARSMDALKRIIREYTISK